MHPQIKKPVIIAIVIIAISAFFALDLERYLTLAFLQQQLDTIHSYYAENRLLSWLLFFLGYSAYITATVKASVTLVQNICWQ